MYRAIEAHPGVRTLYARRLVRDGVLTEEEVRELEARQLAEYEAALAAAKEAAQRPRPAVPPASPRERAPSSRWRRASPGKRSRGSDAC